MTKGNKTTAVRTEVVAERKEKKQRKKKSVKDLEAQAAKIEEKKKKVTVREAKDEVKEYEQMQKSEMIYLTSDASIEGANELCEKYKGVCCGI